MRQPERSREVRFGLASSTVFSAVSMARLSDESLLDLTKREVKFKHWSTLRTSSLGQLKRLIIPRLVQKEAITWRSCLIIAFLL